ncbi:DUF2690 domain-containing protein [Nonomuraea rhodomycinica]|uniref:DUF2690 domain-containing protein n=1 Tax=Nonomuraea rhodomycinica TaxID=1712872 RepID=A0A7Y6IPK7_9ACTN|nr:DUF2690 domain-containing protein [Nonomuraea rhodomycinica]NUW41997.1 hypothetical protein [Nonomuraea rhodomycinica]
MQLRVTAVTVAAAALGLLSGAPAQAQVRTYDHQDPARSGCWNSAHVARTGTLVRHHGHHPAGRINLWWSPRCRTNWVEVTTDSKAGGTIQLYTADRRRDVFDFRPGNNGRHWGNMLQAARTCAWGEVTVRWNSGRALQTGSGGTAKACG